jgi:hypothetical protein
MATATLNPGQFVKFHQFSKMEEDADGAPTIWGVATWEQPDSDNEICDYDTAKPVYQAWSEKAFKRTSRAGQEPSLGNIRLQHGSDVGGKATKLHFDDAAKEVWLGSEPINDDVHQALKKGMYTGYSQGGSYAWRECAKCETPLPLQQGNNACPKCDEWVPVRYGLKRIAEVSYVDSPATGEGFEHVKANGSREILKFAKKAEVPPVANEQKPKREASEIAARTAKAVELLKSRIDAAAVAKGLEKGLYAVGRFADLLESMASLYECAVWEREIEGDESEVPEELKSQLEAMIDTFIAMATEEAKELAAKKSLQPGASNMTPEELELQKAAKKSLASHFAKAASHHEKLADHHEEIADHHEGLADAHKAAHEGCKDCMGKAEAAKAAKLAKADTDPEDAEGDTTIHEVLTNQATFHKAAEKEHKGVAAKHDKIAKVHDKFAEHLHKCAKEHDAEEAEKTIKDIAAFDAANPEAVVKNDTAPVIPSMDADVEKAAAALRDTQEYKDAVSAIAKAKNDAALGAAKALVDAEVAALRDRTIAPTGIAIGEALKTGGFRAVPRTEESETLAVRSSRSTIAGM